MSLLEQLTTEQATQPKQETAMQYAAVAQQQQLEQ